MEDLGVDRTELTCLIKEQQHGKEVHSFHPVQERDKQRELRTRYLLHVISGFRRSDIET